MFARVAQVFVASKETTQVSRLRLGVKMRRPSPPDSLIVLASDLGLCKLFI